MSVTVKLIQRKEKTNRHGFAPVCVRVIDNRKIRYVSTGVSLPVNVWDVNNQCIDPQSDYVRFQSTIDAVRQKVLAELSSSGTGLQSHRNIVRPTIEQYFEKEMELLRVCGKLGTFDKYRYCLALLRHSGQAQQYIDRIDRAYLEIFIAFLKQRGNTNNSISTKLSVLRALYNKAKKDGVVSRDNVPFESIKISWRKTKKRAITKEDILRIRSLDIEDSNEVSSLSFARDMFLFSYLLGGINFGDIARLTADNLQRGRLQYTRNKTGKELDFLLPRDAVSIINRYRQDCEDESQYLFPILNRHIHITNQQQLNRIHKVLGHVNTNLKEMTRMLGLDISLTTYVARHSFATVLKHSGVNIGIISEAMGHRDVKTTEIYLDSFASDRIDEAMTNLL